MFDKSVFKEIINVLQDEKNRKIALLPHVFPDGDAWGSSFALAEWITHEFDGKTVDVISETNIPKHFEKFLARDSSSKFNIVDLNFVEDPDSYDIVVAVDCPSFQKIYEKFHHIFKGNPVKPVTIDIDHHVTNYGVSSIKCIDRKASSAGMVVYSLICSLNRDAINTFIAECLYVSLVSDTGFFSFANATAETLHVASDLAFKCNICEIGALLRDYTHELLNLMGEALHNIRYYDINGYKVAVCPVTETHFLESGAARAHSEKIFEVLKKCRESEIIVMAYIDESNRVKIGINSENTQFRDLKSPFLVADFATEFGGAGHPFAAGFRAKIKEGAEDPVEDLLAVVLDKIEKLTK